MENQIPSPTESVQITIKARLPKNGSKFLNKPQVSPWKSCAPATARFNQPPRVNISSLVDYQLWKAFTKIFVADNILAIAAGKERQTSKRWSDLYGQLMLHPYQTISEDEFKWVLDFYNEIPNVGLEFMINNMEVFQAVSKMNEQELEALQQRNPSEQIPYEMQRITHTVHETLPIAPLAALRIGSEAETIDVARNDLFKIPAPPPKQLHPSRSQGSKKSAAPRKRARPKSVQNTTMKENIPVLNSFNYFDNPSGSVINAINALIPPQNINPINSVLAPQNSLKNGETLSSNFSSDSLNFSMKRNIPTDYRPSRSYGNQKAFLPRYHPFHTQQNALMSNAIIPNAATNFVNATGAQSNSNMNNGDVARKLYSNTLHYNQGNFLINNGLVPPALLTNFIDSSSIQNNGSMTSGNASTTSSYGQEYNLMNKEHIPSNLPTSRYGQQNENNVNKLTALSTNTINPPSPQVSNSMKSGNVPTASYTNSSPAFVQGYIVVNELHIPSNLPASSSGQQINNNINKPTALSTNSLHSQSPQVTISLNNGNVPPASYPSPSYAQGNILINEEHTPKYLPENSSGQLNENNVNKPTANSFHPLSSQMSISMNSGNVPRALCTTPSPYGAGYMWMNKECIPENVPSYTQQNENNVNKSTALSTGSIDSLSLQQEISMNNKHVSPTPRARCKNNKPITLPTSNQYYSPTLSSDSFDTQHSFSSSHDLFMESFNQGQAAPENISLIANEINEEPTYNTSKLPEIENKDVDMSSGSEFDDDEEGLGWVVDVNFVNTYSNRTNVSSQKQQILSTNYYVKNLLNTPEATSMIRTKSMINTSARSMINASARSMNNTSARSIISTSARSMINLCTAYPMQTLSRYRILHSSQQHHTYFNKKLLNYPSNALNSLDNLSGFCLKSSDFEVDETGDITFIESDNEKSQGPHTTTLNNATINRKSRDYKKIKIVFKKNGGGYESLLL